MLQFIACSDSVESLWYYWVFVTFLIVNIENVMDAGSWNDIQSFFHHKDIHPFASYIKTKSNLCVQIEHFLVIFSMVSSTLLIFPSNTKTRLNNKSKEHRLYCYSIAWSWNLLNFVALPKATVICNAVNHWLLLK